LRPDERTVTAPPVAVISRSPRGGTMPSCGC
jgi:hypothetical protein